jgi:glutamate-1-semialdehyde 2,1-aminomutase
MPDDQSNPQSAWLDRARRVLPAGGFGNYAADIVIARGEGGRVWDENGRDYVDLLIGSGPMLVGHSHPEVVEAVASQLPLGQTFFAMNARGIELAEQICEAVACAEKVRFVSSGSEADMYAMRLARAHTGREKILKFEGGYHGMSDQSLMSLAPRRLVNFPMAVPDSAGILQAVREATIVAPFNDAEAVTRLLDEHEGEVAGIIVEPFQRLIPPAPGFLEHLRAETSKRGIVLIFDEVVTGFRLAYGGAQELYGVTPDLCTLGKVIGGGFPLAAIAGSDDVMAHFDKERVGDERFTFQVGTLSGNPIAAVAGLKTMEILRRPGAYDRLRENGRRMMRAATDAFGTAGVPVQLPGDPVLFDIVVADGPVRNYREWFAGDRAKEARIGAIMREHGVLKPAGKVYTHLALTDDDLDRVDAAIHAAAEALAAS